MYLCEFRTGSPVSSGYMIRKWVTVLPIQNDIVRIAGQMHTVSDRYIGMDDHAVVFVKPAPEISGHKVWVFPRRRKYDREDD